MGGEIAGGKCLTSYFLQNRKMGWMLENGVLAGGECGIKVRFYL